MDNTNDKIIFKRLPNDTWGIYGPGLVAGEIVTVTKRDGTTEAVRVYQILDVDADGNWLASFVRIRDKQPVPRHSGFRRTVPDLDIEIDFDTRTKDILTKTLDEAASGAASVPSTQPTANSQRPTTSGPPPIDEASIARAANAVIVPRLIAARKELETIFKEQIEKAADEFYLSDEIKEQIREAAAESAAQESTSIFERWIKTNQEMLEKLERMVPRKIEIKTESFTRILPAEPRHKVFDEVLTTLLSGEHVYLVGEAGTGKTHLFKQIGEALGQQTTILGQTLTKYEFSGHLGPAGEYVTTLLRRAVEDGHLLAIDEIDSSASAAVVFLNSLLANRFIAFPDKMVEAHPSFKLIAAANTFGFGATTQYIGRNPLDAASLDRFTYVECHYDEDLERTLYGDTPWTAYVHRVRQAVNKLELKHIISMRAIDRGRKLLSIGRDPDSVCRAALWRNLAPDTISRIEAISGKFTRKLEEVA